MQQQLQEWTRTEAYSQIIRLNHTQKNLQTSPFYHSSLSLWDLLGSVEVSTFGLNGRIATIEMLIKKHFITLA